MSSAEIPRSFMAVRHRLRYASDAGPGIRRKRRGQGFIYVPDGRRRSLSAADRLRIRALAVPPAWQDVWICPWDDGHLQATGRDARKRKQYRYHPLYRELQDMQKYDRVISFAESLPVLRAAIARHLRMPGLPRKKVLALIVRLLETTLIRIGNAEYASSNGSYGLTTMLDKHVRFAGADRVTLSFKGKSGIEHQVYIDNAKVARLIQRCQELPGQELFQYVDGKGVVRDVTSTHVNRYVRSVTGSEFSAKDFRTWQGTVLAALLLENAEAGRSGRSKKRQILETIRLVAAELGNTPATCRKYYIHPAVFTAYETDQLHGSMERGRTRRRDAGLRRDERAVLCMLKRMANE